MRALCYKCGYDWNYKGNQRGKSNLSCPRCSYRLSADRTIIEDLHTQQEKLHDLPLELHKKPEIIHTYIHKKKELHNFVELEKGIFVNQKIEKQFREGFSLPGRIQEAIYEEEQRQEDSLWNAPVEKPNFEIKLIPHDPIKHLEHQKEYGLRIANIK